jgi:hypothetical protein
MMKASGSTDKIVLVRSPQVNGQVSKREQLLIGGQNCPSSVFKARVGRHQEDNELGLCASTFVEGNGDT